jgi:hypothetical protein
MHITAIGLVVLGCITSAQAAAQTAGYVTGELQLVMTCPPLVKLGVNSLPVGWLPVANGSSLLFHDRLVYSNGYMNCTYGDNGGWIIFAVPPPSYPKCKIDPGSNDKFVCTQ